MKESAAAAGQKTPPVTVEAPPDSDDTIDAPLTPELKLEAFFESIQADDDVSIGIYQIDPSNRSRKGFLFYCDPESAKPHELFEQILVDWGAGEYEAIARDGQRISFSQRFILGSVRKQRPELRSPATAGRATPAIDPVIAAILDRQQKTLDLLVERSAQGGAGSTLETLRELAEMQKLIAPPPAAPAGGLTDVLGIVQQVLELKDQLGGNDGEADVLTTAVKTLGPAIVKAVEAMNSYPQRRIPGGVEDLGPGTPARAPEVNAQGAGRLIGPYLPTILASARGGVLPIDVARQILTNLDAAPIASKAALLDYLDDEQAVDKIAAMDPNGEPIQLREWFDQLIDVLCASLKQQIADAGAEDEQQGDLELPQQTELEAQLAGSGREVGEQPAPSVDSAPATQGADIADTPSGAD